MNAHVFKFQPCLKNYQSVDTLHFVSEGAHCWLVAFFSTFNNLLIKVFLLKNPLSLSLVMIKMHTFVLLNRPSHGAVRNYQDLN